jgi:DNA primase
MQAHQAGFSNVVAQMGTALTESQLKQLQRYTKRLVLALDPDAAGISATLRGVEVAQETLEQAWEPVFDPRGLVGYESRLGAEIRVLRLPSGQDPDDLIREDAQRWTELVEGAVSVVDFYLQMLMEGLDLDDTQAKARVVDTLLPVLRAVTNPVEREDYAQKIARSLQVSAQSVLARLRGVERQAARRQSDAASANVQLQQGRPEADLESHSLSALLRRPSLLRQINDRLAENRLEALQGKDFQDAGNRAIYETWRDLIAADAPTPVETLQEQLPQDLHARLEELLAPDQSALADDQLVRDISITVLRLRERSLRQLGQELRFLTLEAREAGDIRAQEYVEALRAYKETLLRTQQALAQR